MKIYDISQEVFNCNVYPGDPAPERKVVLNMADGEVCNLTAFRMCAHNGTHIDAPYHFYNNGKTVDEIPLDKLVGNAFVVTFDGEMSADDARNIICRAKSLDCEKRILFKGDTIVTNEAAKVLAYEDVYLIGNESQTVGPHDAPMDVHFTLLEKEVVLLEGIRLDEVKDGVYFLCAAPINLGASDGAPCRALLIDLKL